MTMMTSACKYCGQMASVEAETEAEALHLATMGCNCEDALNYQEIYIRAENATLEMQELYKDEKVQQKVIDLSATCIELMAGGLLQGMQLALPNGKKLKISKKGNGFTVSCSRSDSRQVSV